MPLRHIHAVAMAFMQVAAGAPQAVQTLLSFVPLQLDHFERSRPLLDRTLGLSYAERSVCRQRSVDGRSSRDRYRTACLRRIVGFSQFSATYAWTLPLPVPRRRLVPNVGCQNLRIPPDCSQTRGSVPIVAGASSRRVPVMAGSTQLTTTIGTRYCAPQTADALKSSRYLFAAVCAASSTRRVDASR